MKKAAQIFNIGLLLSVVSLTASTSLAEADANPMAATCRHSETRFNCVEYVDNYDGDTLTFNIKNVHPLLGHHAKIRIAGINTAEMRSLDPCERDVAYRAQMLVQTELSKAKRIDLLDVGRGKYFRILADVIYDGNKSVGDLLLRRKLGFRYDGGTKPVIDWCSL
ncbi:MAG: thermonuclease family protein [Bdellovibrionaceae bacterium]|nr:thermonuclease family protein [Pseudobdellovibrionaceae bacterium]